MWWLPVIIIGSLASLAMASYFWNDIRESFISWLERNGLYRSSVKKATVYLDTFFVGLRRQVKATLKIRLKGHQITRTVEEKIYNDIEEIDDEEIREALRRHGKLKLEVEL